MAAHAGATSTSPSQINTSDSGPTDSQPADLAKLNGFLGLGGDPAATQKAFQDYLNSTGYQFDKTQGLDAVSGSKAASGLLGSGSLAAALDAYGTGLAQSYGQNYINDLTNETKIGAGSANALAQSGQAFANASNANSTNAANAAGKDDLATSASINSLLGNALKVYGASPGGSSFGGGGSGGNAFAPGIGG